MNPAIVANVATAAVTLTAVAVVLRQCRKPSWLPGRFFLWTMNRSHSGVTNWGLSHVDIARDFTVLDIGCGGGQTIHTLAAKASEGKVYGIDYSAASVAVSRNTNARDVESGHVDIRQGTVSSLPYAENTFDIVTAVETHYYWPNLVADLREVRRVLKPGGRVVLIAETYRGMHFDALYQPVMKLLRATYLTLDEHRDVLANAGYSDVVVDTEQKKGWVCGVARKPL